MIELNDELLEDKSPIMKIAFRMIIRAAKDILYGKCDEGEVTQFIADVNPEKNGYYKEDDFLNVEESMQILQLGKNRIKFFNLIKEYNISNKKISNMPVGYLKKEIFYLKKVIEEDAVSTYKILSKKDKHRRIR